MDQGLNLVEHQSNCIAWSTYFLIAYDGFNQTFVIVLHLCLTYINLLNCILNVYAVLSLVLWFASCDYCSVYFSIYIYIFIHFNVTKWRIYHQYIWNPDLMIFIPVLRYWESTGRKLPELTAINLSGPWISLANHMLILSRQSQVRKFRLHSTSWHQMSRRPSSPWHLQTW